ncbi:MAG: oligosaccharyl transferase, archaeosortase A system-associated [Chloroflexota bacterium]
MPQTDKTNKRHGIKHPEFIPILIDGILLLIIFAVALYFRIALPYDKVFTDVGIKFSGSDTYAHMTLVDNIVHNFPHVTSFDPYMLYPGGAGIGTANFFDLFLATIIWIIGLGSPSQHLIDVIGVYYPAILGALTIFPVYFIGRALASRWAGIFAAGLISFMPGEFMGRSILGFTDHHVAEALFSTTVIAFLILAIRSARSKELTLRSLWPGNWKTNLKPILYSALAGLFLAIYLYTWMGALLFIFITALFFVAQFVIDHLRHKSSDYLAVVGFVFFLVTTLIIAPILPRLGLTHIMIMTVATLLPIAANWLSHLLTAKNAKTAYYPLALLGLGVVGLGAIRLISPSLFTYAFSYFSIFRPMGASLTTIEMQPLISSNYNPAIAIAWGNFATCFFIAPLGLVLLLYSMIKAGSAEKTLVAIWSLVMLAATIGQRRFGYYFAVNVALLSGYLFWWVLMKTGLIEYGTKQPAVEIGGRRARTKKERSQTLLGYVNLGLAIVIIVLIVLAGGGETSKYPSMVVSAKVTASRVSYAPSDSWVSSLTWLKDNSPEPFGDPDFYYHLETNTQYRSLNWLKANVPNPTGDPNFYNQLPESYDYPASAYGVLSWWDYGYWIERIAHRIPNANPSQEHVSVVAVANFLTSQNETSADTIAQELGTKYIVIDYDTPTSKFYAVILWAGKPQSDFFDIYYLPQDNLLQPVQLFHPAYYHSTSTRLFNFDGNAVTPDKVLVISYEDRETDKGQPYKLLTSANELNSYEEAQAYLASQQSGNYRIVGVNPFISPIPLEAVTSYELVYSSEGARAVSTVGDVPELKIFRRIN